MNLICENADDCKYKPKKMDEISCSHSYIHTEYEYCRGHNPMRGVDYKYHCPKYECITEFEYKMRKAIKKKENEILL